MTTVESRVVEGFAQAPRRLYFARFAFAIVWAVLLFLLTRSSFEPVGIVLVVALRLGAAHHPRSA